MLAALETPYLLCDTQGWLLCSMGSFPSLSKGQHCPSVSPSLIGGMLVPGPAARMLPHPRSFPAGRCRYPGRAPEPGEAEPPGGGADESRREAAGPVSAHGCEPGAAGGGRVLRRFPPAEPGAGAVGAAAAVGPAQPVEVAQHLDLAGSQRAQRRRGAGRVSGTGTGDPEEIGRRGGPGMLEVNGGTEGPQWEPRTRGHMDAGNRGVGGP